MVDANNKKFLNRNDIGAYKIATTLGDYVWDKVSQWDAFNRQALGAQYVRAVDSIAGNTAEGFGRYFKKDKQKFYYYSRGSVYEAIHWTEKARIRKLINLRDYDLIIKNLNSLPREINWLIRITEEKLTI